MNLFKAAPGNFVHLQPEKDSESFDFWIHDACDAILINCTLFVNAGQDTKGTEANDLTLMRLSPYSLLFRCVYLFPRVSILLSAGREVWGRFYLSK